MNFFKREKLICSFLFSLVFSGLASENYSLPEALKVLKAIDIIKEEAPKTGGSLKKIEVTESELNSYIAYRIEKEKEEIMKELRLKLFEGNRIEGKISIDLRNYRIFFVLPPQMNLYFEGQLQIEARKVRFKFKKLFLENQAIPVFIFDLILYISSQIDKTETSSIKDWYDLPYGIKDIKTLFRRAFIYY